MQAAQLTDRGVVEVFGGDARTFLNGLLTSDIAKVTPQAGRYAALLTPQGKVLIDAIVVQGADEGGFLLDAPQALVPDLIARLTFYKLRAKLAIEDRRDRLGVIAIWGGDFSTCTDGTYEDPRLAALGRRMIVPLDQVDAVLADLGAESATADDYDRHRIGLGVPRGGVDFIYGDAFPHEADMDQLGGVDFKKGCYVGQEVVSRMEHRGSARTRIVPFETDGGAPETGLPVTAGDKLIGTTGSAAGGRGLAMLRLDRMADAVASAQPLMAGGIVLRPGQPSWATFSVPGATAAS